MTFPIAMLSRTVALYPSLRWTRKKNYGDRCKKDGNGSSEVCAEPNWVSYRATCRQGDKVRYGKSFAVGGTAGTRGKARARDENGRSQGSSCPRIGIGASNRNRRRGGNGRILRYHGRSRHQRETRCHGRCSCCFWSWPQGDEKALSIQGEDAFPSIGSTASNTAGARELIKVLLEFGRA